MFTEGTCNKIIILHMEGLPSQEKAKTYNLKMEGDVLKMSFGTPASNADIVKDAVSEIERLTTSGEMLPGNLIKLNGPASLPVAVAITNGLSNSFETIAVFDPKLNGYVVAISISPEYKVGSILQAE
jgi:CRISPR-associated protein Csx3